MKKRVLAAVVLLPLFLIVILVLPKIFATILFAVIAVFSTFELLHKTGLVKQLRLTIYAMVMSCYMGFWSGRWGTYPMAMLGIFVFTCLALSELLVSHGKTSVKAVAVTLMGGALIPYLITAPLRLLNWPNGRFLVLIPFVIAFMSDTGAYFAGIAFGKHKLAPNISPNKTIEGLFGGIVAAVLGVLLYCFAMDKLCDFRISYIDGFAYGFLGSLGAVFGDLCFSAIKRQVKIKDYGNLIPGHGGILDRFDSVVIVAILTEALTYLSPLVVK